jgi:EpsI family protein
MPNFLKTGVARLVTLFLILQTVAVYSAMRPETVPPGRPLAEFPTVLGTWELAQEGVVDQETRDVLKADDLLTRDYHSARASQNANLFVAAFQSQRNGKTPHSPKNCLPGNGWLKAIEEQYPLDLGKAAPIIVNRYVVTHGAQRSVVIYWYQSRDRVVASEYQAKFWVIMDSIRLHRTDTALVKVTVPVIDSDDDGATRAAVDFIKSFYPSLRQFLPA